MIVTPDQLPASLHPGIEDATLARASAVPVADPLWMLQRQAAFGEFAAQDLGSPAMVQITGDSNTMTALRPDPARADDIRPYDPRVMPLEMAGLGDSNVLSAPMHYKRSRSGLGALRILRRHKVSAEAIKDLLDRFDLPALDDAHRSADAANHMALRGGRSLDGFALRDQFRNAPPSVFLASVATGLDPAALEALSAELLRWARALDKSQPQGVWQDSRQSADFDVLVPEGNAPAPQLEALITNDVFITGGRPLFDSFTPVIDMEAIVNTPGGSLPGGLLGGLGSLLTGLPRTTELHIRDHAGGRLDWFSLTATTGAVISDSDLGRPAPEWSRTLVPTAIRFPGTPVERLWSVEPDGAHYTHLSPAPEDLARLIVAEFALSGSQGWMSVPIDVTAGSVTRFESVTVRDVFGRESAANPVPFDPDAPFAFQRISRTDDPRKVTDLFVAMPTLPLSQSSPPLEEVAVLRDAAANMVWAVETTCADPETGLPLDRTALEIARADPPEPRRARTEATYGYEVSNIVRQNWFPMLIAPEDRPDLPRQLTLARLLSSAHNVVPTPFGRILAGTPVLDDETVPPAGLSLTRKAHRVRWSGGGVKCWTARRREAHKPRQGGSGLVYDQLVPMTGAARAAPINPPRLSLRDAVAYGDDPARRSLRDMLKDETGAATGTVSDALKTMAKRYDGEGD